MIHPGPAGFAALACGLVLIFALSLMQGAQHIPAARLLETLVAPDGSREYLILSGIRLPRALTGMLAAKLTMAAAAAMLSREISG